MRTRSLNRLTAAVTLSLFLGAAAVAGARQRSTGTAPTSPSRTRRPTAT